MQRHSEGLQRVLDLEARAILHLAKAREYVAAAQKTKPGTGRRDEILKRVKQQKNIAGMKLRKAKLMADKLPNDNVKAVTNATQGQKKGFFGKLFRRRSSGSATERNAMNARMNALSGLANAYGNQIQAHVQKYPNLYPYGQSSLGDLAIEQAIRKTNPANFLKKSTNNAIRGALQNAKAKKSQIVSGQSKEMNPGNGALNRSNSVYLNAENLNKQKNQPQSPKKIRENYKKQGSPNKSLFRKALEAETRALPLLQIAKNRGNDKFKNMGNEYMRQAQNLMKRALNENYTRSPGANLESSYEKNIANHMAIAKEMYGNASSTIGNQMLNNLKNRRKNPAAYMKPSPFASQSPKKKQPQPNLGKGMVMSQNNHGKSLNEIPNTNPKTNTVNKKKPWTEEYQYASNFPSMIRAVANAMGHEKRLETVEAHLNTLLHTNLGATNVDPMYNDVENAKKALANAANQGGKVDSNTLQRVLRTLMYKGNVRVNVDPKNNASIVRALANAIDRGNNTIASLQIRDMLKHRGVTFENEKYATLNEARTKLEHLAKSKDNTRAIPRLRQALRTVRLELRRKP